MREDLPVIHTVQITKRENVEGEEFPDIITEAVSSELKVKTFSERTFQLVRQCP